MEPGSLIMIAEDRADHALFMSHILRESDYQVIWVRDGQRALELITSGMVPEILLTDIKMPTLNGFGLMAEMRRFKIKIPTIVISGIDTNASFEEAFLLGAEDYLVKPFPPVRLIARINRLLNTPHFFP